MCIYYQDELAFCCINGLDLQVFDNNEKCLYEYEMENCPKGITINGAEKMKQKLEALRPILKAIEHSSNSRSPRIALEALILNENWFRVWELLDSE